MRLLADEHRSVDDAASKLTDAEALAILLDAPRDEASMRLRLVVELESRFTARRLPFDADAT